LFAQSTLSRTDIIGARSTPVKDEGDGPLGCGSRPSPNSVMLLPPHKVTSGDSNGSRVAHCSTRSLARRCQFPSTVIAPPGVVLSFAHAVIRRRESARNREVGRRVEPGSCTRAEAGSGWSMLREPTTTGPRTGERRPGRASHGAWKKRDCLVVVLGHAALITCSSFAPVWTEKTPYLPKGHTAKA
jgi:hypothetical protein